jgi:hypothetical protein
MRALRASLVVLGAGAAACGGPASYPDGNAVIAAQAEWCKALAKLSGAGDGWDSMATCKAALPTSSAGYLRAMTKCFPDRRRAAGDGGPDNWRIAGECRDEVLVRMKIDEAAAQEFLDAHCDRAARCEKVATPDCMAALRKLESSQRAQLFGVYNGASLHTMAGCIKSTSCSTDEDAAQDACAKPLADKLLWFP